MSHPCKKCIILAACIGKHAITCSLLLDYFHKYRTYLLERQREIEQKRYLGMHMRDKLWLEAWDHVTEVMPNCRSFHYNVQTGNFNYLKVETKDRGITYEKT